MSKDRKSWMKVVPMVIEIHLYFLVWKRVIITVIIRRPLTVVKSGQMGRRRCMVMSSHLGNVHAIVFAPWHCSCVHAG